MHLSSRTPLYDVVDIKPETRDDLVESLEGVYGVLNGLQCTVMGTIGVQVATMNRQQRDYLVQALFEIAEYMKKAKTINR